MNDNETTASFGYRDVPEAEKQLLVREVFSSVAPRYDLMNDLMSGGLHRLWKDAMVEWLNPQPGMRVLDVAGGTGDIALRIGDRAGERGGHPEIILCDINTAMMAQGRTRPELSNIESVRWLCADAEHLPLMANSFDAYTIAFGIRNVTHIEQALAEAFRVLKPGGRFLCLEFSKVDTPLLDTLYDRYSFHVLPRIGAWVANDADSYRYLAESIRRFPPTPRFVKMLQQAGFARVNARKLSGGIAAIHSGWKI